MFVCVTMEENGAHFFEGTEKLLEVWFSRQDDAKGTGDLRSIPRLVMRKKKKNTHKKKMFEAES